ncbi:MAG: protein disulfide oxidoreductase [Gammaproteobacteria bacterium]
MQALLKRRGIKIVLELGVVVLLYFGIRAYMQWHLASGSAPPIHAEMLSGRQFDITQPRKGPLLIHFWATWCPICRLEQKSIQSLSQRYTVISIAMNSGNAKSVRHFMQQHGLSFPVINDPDGTIARRYGVTAVPVSFVVNRRNQIRFVERGYTTEWGLRLRLWLSG